MKTTRYRHVIIPASASVMILSGALVALDSPPVSSAPPVFAVPLAPACIVDPARELLITDLSVVEDQRAVYPGPWSFGKLIEDMAGDQDPQAFVEQWLQHFDFDQYVNGFRVPFREGFHEMVVDPWLEASQQNGVKGLDLSIAPFRLLAIVNRIDLRQNGYGQVVSGGEGRMVFGFLDALGDPETGDLLRGTVILEYELAASGCGDLLDWAEAWHRLGTVPLGTEAYNAALQAVTDRFTSRNAMPHNPNGSALRQLRTNELISLPPWEWREFKLSANSGYLEQGTVAQTPDLSLDGTRLLASFVNANEAAILAGTHVVPETWMGQPFLGGAADGDPFSNHFEAPGIASNDARHLFSLNTCTGCHTNETGVAFFQLGPRMRGNPVFPSGFLTGTSVPDPVEPKTTRTFNDLKRRTQHLCRLLSSSCQTLSNDVSEKRVH